MKVTIKVPFGKMTFQMSTVHALELLKKAVEYAEFRERANDVGLAKATPPKVETVLLRNENAVNVLDKEEAPVKFSFPSTGTIESVLQRVKENIDSKIAESGETGTDEQTPAPAPKQKEPMKSRVETMFGDRATWNKPAEEQKPEPPKCNYSEGYRGFLYIRCDKCGEVKGFCTKSPILQSRCDQCGHNTDLRDLLPMFVKCECGAEFKYKTNMIANAFTYNCLRCGSPIDMELNGKGTAFVTMASQERRNHDKR